MVPLAVVAAHRTGQPLHPQIVAAGGRFREVATTAAVYRLLALHGDGVPRGGLIRVDDGGAGVEVEVHEVPAAALPALAAGLPHALTIGEVELVDGRRVPGFVCTAAAADAGVGEDITAYGSWPAYLATLAVS